MSDPAHLPTDGTEPASADPFTAGADALRVEGLGTAQRSTSTNGVPVHSGAVNGANGSGRNGIAADGQGVHGHATAVPSDDHTSAGAADGPSGETDGVIDLREGATTRVRVSKDANPFNALTKQERMRLIVRVLCEIVAYGELEEGQLDAVQLDDAQVDGGSVAAAELDPSPSAGTALHGAPDDSARPG